MPESIEKYISTYRNVFSLFKQHSLLDICQHEIIEDANTITDNKI